MGFKHFGGNLFLSVSGQAVEHHSVRLGGGHYFVVDLVVLKDLFPLCFFFFLTHRGPYIRVDHICVFGAGQNILTASEGAVLLGPGHDLSVRLVVLGAGDGALHTHGDGAYD